MHFSISPVPRQKVRVAFIVTHPIQYYVPLYRRLAARDDLEIKVFFTWHSGQAPVHDRGFKKSLAWDIPLTEGYDFELVSNIALESGTHHFWGLCNPGLISRVLKWQPDRVCITGWAYSSHLWAIHELKRRGVPVFFRGDSHLLDGISWWRWSIKHAFLSLIYRWPDGFLYVGQANREYYRAFGVPEEKLFPCSHSIEVDRFANPQEELEREAAAWRKELGLDVTQSVLLFAGKFEDKKRPLQLMKVVKELDDSKAVLVMVGDGELGDQVRQIARSAPDRFRVLPFQNQSRMPLVYRLGDLFILPSAYNETWGLAVNEALSCGRPVLVSDKVGCARELVTSGRTGEIFRADNWSDFREKLDIALNIARNKDRWALIRFAYQFDIETTENHLVHALVIPTNKDGSVHKNQAVSLA